MSNYTLEQTTIFDAVTAQITTPVALDIRSLNITVPITIAAKGLAGVETVSIWFSVDEGLTYTEYMVNGSQLVLDVNNNVRAVYSGIYLGFTKTASIGAVTVIANTQTRE